MILLTPLDGTWPKSLAVLHYEGIENHVAFRVKVQSGRSISDLEAGLERQILSLEAEDASPSCRKRIAQGIGELDGALVEKRRQQDQLAAPAPQFADVAGLSRSYLSIICTRLNELPTAETAVAVRRSPTTGDLPPRKEGGRHRVR